MSDGKPKRLSIIARELNVSTHTIIQYLADKGYIVENNPNAKVSEEYMTLLDEKFKDSKSLNEKAIKNIEIAQETKKTTTLIEKEQAKVETSEKETTEKTTKKEEVKKEDKAEKKTEEIPPVAVQEIIEEPKAVSETVQEIEQHESIKHNIETSEKKEEPIETEVLHEETIEESKAVKFKDHEIVPLSEEEKIEYSNMSEGPKILGKINLSEINRKRKIQEEISIEKKKKYKEEKIARLKEQQAASKATPPKYKNQTTPIKEEATPKEEAPKTEEIKPIIENKPVAKVKPVIENKPEKIKEEFIPTKIQKLTGPNVVGRIDVDDINKRQQEAERKKQLAKEERQKNLEKEKREKRKRIEKVKVKVGEANETNKPYNKDHQDKNKDNRKDGGGGYNNSKNDKKPKFKKSFSNTRTQADEENIQKQIKETLARLTSPKQKSKTSKHRREKRDIGSQKRQAEYRKQEAERNILKVTEFVTVNELATMMDVPVNNLIGTFMSLGLFVSINQRLDAETMSIVADEYGYQVEFVSAEVLNEIQEIQDNPEDLQHRPPIVTVMGHVDHGKTKLLDQVRNTNVVAGEAGGITQHIGAYSVKLEDGRQITFLDTPGHEAFTAMRARGAQITDVAIIVIAADDSIMPQTKEAINHASAAGVPIVFAINKIDKPAANPEKIREELANMNYLVEEWGGKYQSQEISAKQGINIEELLEKVLFESEILELKANPNRIASGTIIESSLDKGRGYVATLLVQNGTLKIGDILLAGCQTGRVKAMYNERGQKIEVATPSTPVLVLGLNGAPQAGDKFNVMESDAEARNIANRRTQLQRELGLRTQKHITLDEIGRRLSLGNFNEINIIIKGDVDGSIEALADSLIKLSTENFVVNIIHKAVGQISESDVMLATASNAIIVGFQVRPSGPARKLAEKEEIEIRLYSVIYDAIDEIRDAMVGMLKPTIKENIIGTAEVKETFRMSKVGIVAGCLVIDGKILKTSKVRVIRDGIVIYSGELGSLKRFKDDAKEVSVGLDCGLNIDKFNDVKVGDIIEAFEQFEEKATL